jgi:hypothetical protein
MVTMPVEIECEPNVNVRQNPASRSRGCHRSARWSE